MRLGSVLGIVLLAMTAQAAESVPLESVVPRTPEAEPGWTVRRFDGGYARWQVDSADETGGGSVQVVPAPKRDERAGEPESSAVKDAKRAREPEPQLACEAEKRKLAVRLLALRGIEATESSALLLLAAEEAPLSPRAWAGVRGLGPGAGSSLIATAYASDLVARDLVDTLARCLAQSR